MLMLWREWETKSEIQGRRCTICKHDIKHHEPTRRLLKKDDAVVGRSTTWSCAQCNCNTVIYTEIFTEQDEQALWHILAQQPDYEEYTELKVTTDDIQTIIVMTCNKP